MFDAYGVRGKEDVSVTRFKNVEKINCEWRKNKTAACDLSVDIEDEDEEEEVEDITFIINELLVGGSNMGDEGDISIIEPSNTKYLDCKIMADEKETALVCQGNLEV